VVTLRRILFSDLEGAEPPTEFRIFKAGENASTKGVFLFDDAAARSVMAAYAAQAVDCMIDLEHGALGDAARPDSGDARGWFKLELRAGELWAVGVKWSPDGARRLAEKCQRYTSPAFLADEHNRITELINVALVAMPATHGAAPLVAASKRASCAPNPPRYTVGCSPHKATLTRMSPELLKKVLAAIEAGEDKSGLLAEIVAAAAGGAPEADPGADALADTAETPPEEDKPAAELAALTARLTKLEAERDERTKKLSARVEELEAERAAGEHAERVELVAELVKLGRETPATAWEGEPEKRQPAKRFVSEPVAELRARVELYRQTPIAGNAAPAAAPAPAAITLSKEQKAYCEKHGLTPEQFEARKAATVKKATK
jgi:phage I-like protein